MDFWTDFIAALKKAPSSLLLRTIDFVRAAEISVRMEICPLQDPLRFRAVFLGRAIAEALVDEQGNLLLDRAKVLREELGRGLFWIGPRLEEDHWILSHLHRALGFLLESGEIQKRIRSFSPPLCNLLAEQLIRQTLWPTPIQYIRADHLVKAVLTAWFTWLRQITGSCFATAPAIAIQQEQPLRLLNDLQEMVTRGGIRKIVEGKEYVVPLSPSLIHSDLLRPISSIGSRERLSYAPGLIAAFSVGKLFPAGSSIGERTEKLGQAIRFASSAATPKELIEQVLLHELGIEPKELEEEAALERLQMNPLLAKQSAIYYQRESSRAKKVAEWKERVSLASSAYQALTDCALLRAWESTIASFSDVKVDFGRWNLFVSLGMSPDHTSGIGEFLYRRIDEALQETNQKIVSLRGEYEEASRGAEALEVLFHRSVNEEQRHQLKSEWTTLIYTLNNSKIQLDELSTKAEQLVHLFSYMIGSYDRKIQESFQEIFDPSLAQLPTEMIDDSPAGFRLAYKHGNFDAALWTFISDEETFIRILSEFFISMEKEMIEEKPEQEKIIGELSTELIHYVKTPEFMEGAMSRASANVAIMGGYKKPWEYISGGTMESLLMAYYQRNQPFSSLDLKIESPMQLLQFLLQCKEAAGDATTLFIHSPTHAFLFKPKSLPENADQVVEAMRAFWQERGISDEEEEKLIELYSETLPFDERPLFLHRQRQQGSAGNLNRLREQFIDREEKRVGSVDSFLYESFPLISEAECNRLATVIGAEWKFPSMDGFFSGSKFWAPVQFRERLKSGFLKKAKSPLASFDLDELIAERLRKEGLAPPRPLFFGDTNWTAGRFALAISPSGELDLWRFQRTGMTGFQMGSWFRNQEGGSWHCFIRASEFL